MTGWREKFIVVYNEPALILQANSARAIEKTMTLEPALILAERARISSMKSAGAVTRRGAHQEGGQEGRPPPTF
jgi:hypothetical protein